MSEVEYRLTCFRKLEELYSLYDKVRQSVILLENFDDEREMYIAPINQLRSALDHIFKAVNNCKDAEQSDYELKEAKEHLDRAGYDALELLAANLGENVVKKLGVYETSTLTQIFPLYFTEIKPKLTDIKQVVATLRNEKKVDSEKSFSAYFDQITELIDINKQVDRMIPSLEEYDTKRRKESRKTWVVGLVSAIISGIAVGVVVFLLTT